MVSRVHARSRAARRDLSDVPFGQAQAYEVVAPVGFELLFVADALHLRDGVEDTGEPGAEHGLRREPAFACCVDSVLKRSGFGLQVGGDYTPEKAPASWRGLAPTLSGCSALRSIGAQECYPAG